MHHPQRHAPAREHSKPSSEHPWCFLVCWGVAVGLVWGAWRWSRRGTCAAQPKKKANGREKRVFIPPNPEKGTIPAAVAPRSS